MAMLAYKPPLYLGTDMDTKEPVTIADKDRYASTYVLGNTGTGKSGFLKTQIQQDIAMGNAVIVIDPHGDLANDCMAALPPERVANAYVLDMEDEAYPFGLNIFGEAGTFTTEVEHSQAIQRIYHLFEVLWPEIEGQQYLPTLLRNATGVFLDNPGHTLIDMMRFFRDDVFRAKLLANTKDPTIREDFATEFDNLTPRDQKNIVAPLMRRLRSIFVGRGLIRNILGQRETSINFRRSIERHEVIFIKLPTTAMEEDAQLIGTFIMAEITSAIFSFRDTPPDERPGVSLYVDEFQNFVTKDFDRIITEARKFGVRLTIAHQYREQLKGETGAILRKSTTTVRTKICFRIGADNAKEMAAYFPSYEEETLEPDTHSSKYLLEQGVSDPYATEFTDTYLRALRERGGGKFIEITDEGWSAGKVFGLVSPFGTPAKPEKIKVLNPLPFLDKLLYGVMRMGNPELDIPHEVMVGFSNTTYHGFYQQALRARYKPVPDPHLVYDRGDGNPRWLRRPTDGTEQFQHFMFFLDRTMRYLAAHPFGKATASKAPDVAAMLTRLDNRYAFVRAGDDIAGIYTLELPAMLTGADLHRRMEHIKDQSRAKYCSPRGAIDAAITGREPPMETHGNETQARTQPAVPANKPLNRWEDIEE